MTANPKTISPNQLCGDILDKMREGGFRHLPVIDQGRLVGVISIRDIHAAVINDLEEDFARRCEGARKAWRFIRYFRVRLGA